MLTMPVEATPNQQFQVVLDDQNCTIALYQRGKRMYLDLYVDDTAICQGMICLPTVGVPRNSRDFSGKIFVVDTLSTPSRQEAPQWEGLGSRWNLVFLTADEVEELKSKNESWNG